MRTYRLAITAFLLALCVAGIYAMSHRDIVDNTKSLTVLITNERLGGGGRGSGILLDGRHVLTCFHMLETPRDTLFVYTYPFGQVIKAHVESVDQRTDLALLTLESSATVRAKPVFQVTVHDGDPITVIGNALGGMSWYVTGGVIAGEDRGSILTDATINPGDSGGPWVNEEGEIIAMTDWRIGPSSDRHYLGLAGGTSAADMLAFLKSYDNQKRAMAALERLLGGS